MKDKVNSILLIILIFTMLTNLYLIFYYAPLEKVMGVVQKIFYFHVASAWIGFLALAVVFASNILYLRCGRKKWSQLSLASAEIGVVFISIVLITGPLWAKPVWNTWWTWDPRLTTTLILWFMYVAYLILHGGREKNEKRERLAAVYGIIAFINVPLVFFSIRWWRTIHPVVISTSGISITGEMLFTLLFSLATFTLLYVYLLKTRCRGIKLAYKIDLLKERIGGY
ncbi:cytochrome c biogenesis protein [Halothermothrix orenii]|uniref:Heme exporter protein C n=1 Tax=Halothermothrix orenii (strain H 168 / OCM 544 / DSM 9562) TaxID=373903 RepID=B8D1R2_HALOH|nr:cytochrome c biogenesis protein CcsA [Halothermothrix orenii]ACL69139.1 cytochrome c assembly protein [Halothermothrix orenii H 168]